MKTLLVSCVALLAVGCTTLRGAPATINSSLDWALCSIEPETDKNRYYLNMEINRILQSLASEGDRFVPAIEFTYTWNTELRTAEERCMKYLELKEALHQHYLTTGRWK